MVAKSSTDTTMEELAKAGLLVPKAIQEQAAKCWKTSLELYAGKNGLRELKDKAKTIAADIGKNMLELAQACVKHAGGENAPGLLFFRGACAMQEAKVKEETGEKNLMLVNPTWQSNKSVIVRGLERKGNNKVDIFHAVTGALNPDTGKPTLEPMTISKLRSIVAVRPVQVTAVKLTPKLQAALSALNNEIVGLTDEQQSHIADHVSSVVKVAFAYRTAGADAKAAAVAKAEAETGLGGIEEPATGNVAVEETKQERKERMKRTGTR